MVTGVVYSSCFSPSIFFTHRAQQSQCSSIFHPVLRYHALALSERHFVLKKKSQRIYTSVHWGGLELTKLGYNRVDDNLICHRGGVCVDPWSRARESTCVVLRPIIKSAL